MNSSPRHLFGSFAPLSPSLCPGARPALLHPPLWCVGVSGAIRFFWRAFGAKEGLMLEWVVAGGGLEAEIQ